MSKNKSLALQLRPETNEIKLAKTKEYIKYTPIQRGNVIPEERIIEIIDEEIDPFDPPKFKYQKVVARQVVEPVPILHAPPKKATKEEMEEWKIPPCISNWKNKNGYTIALDKRVAADGRHLEQTEIGERHAEFAEALYLAEKASAEENAKKVEMKRKVEMAKKEKNEEEMRKLAMAMRKLREEEEVGEVDEGRERRDQAREERRKDREEFYRKAGYKGLQKDMERERKRDVAESIALGKKVDSKDLMFDQRLFNQESGVTSGFGDEDDYNVYDKNLFNPETRQYRPKDEKDE
ncbi:Puff-specific protein Bx42, putative [Entamoeba invadens IP1]|uniref:Puff-specific protein Bx42, putative n=1 Tax=Entamoeba invadens IP1 TaxID=370355 RepID=A0A0A1U2M3_ENTIV|nr:Puff-specific protein Bx42, putative [Entamoeba invadens IP1]ELP88326.1 Puff-specific protein Bx42, putative [Entamoeba invadens IP1]|eukprot:XP_004255097.1 Puff-specific protein Bx42, putative [Entamoeba invadens IP1]